MLFTCCPLAVSDHRSSRNLRLRYDTSYIVVVYLYTYFAYWFAIAIKRFVLMGWSLLGVFNEYKNRLR